MVAGEQQADDDNRHGFQMAGLFTAADVQRLRAEVGTALLLSDLLPWTVGSHGEPGGSLLPRDRDGAGVQQSAGIVLCQPR